MINMTMDTTSFNSSTTPKEPQPNTPEDPAPPAPLITFLPPQGQLNYLGHNHPLNQPDNIPKTFLDAMSVREKVYVQEQSIALENEFDDDDHRSCHWVLYTSAFHSPQTSTPPIPIGTIRLVPFPHPPHPLNGGIYLNNTLTNPSPQPNSPTTTYHHNENEPYIKLGRLAVIKEHRNKGLARHLVRAAIDWMQTHPATFNPSPPSPSPTTLEMDVTAGGGELPKWRGLFCIHAQEDAVTVWEKYGFRVDEKMGRWWEEGIPHVGMWLRVKVGREREDDVQSFGG
ncbi:acyl-CoA N-acyltransferase [Triangularia verruculosa]|uniref:Acyl-CoA N-acyltransferase n=1 Tax=Triangularia verruculosa TaxID=2587418 RepID=A0AAN7ASM6_9PEZI|nr:acyl-CoA N-acyltransferase [Triangularia verruculosa]